MQIVNRSIGSIMPYEKNPRKNDDAVKYVAESIKQFGFKVPIVIDSDGIIVAGHTRYKAAKKLKLQEVPCIVADDLTEEQVKAFRLADNKVAEKAEWDFDLLDEELGDILDIDMESFGFEFDIEEEEPEAEEDDYEVEVPEEPKAKLGDIYQLGNHRLMCGDSTSIADVDLLMDGAKADMVHTDPPYNISMSRSKVDGSDNSIKNDNLDNESFYCLLKEAFSNACRVCRTQNMFWWIGFRAYSTLEQIFLENNVKIANCIVWKKNSIGLGGKGFRYQHELGIFSGETNNKSKSDVWEFDRTKEGLHPTMKPVPLVAHALQNIDNANIVLDLFGGSGSTLIACEQLNRKCFMMELDPKYVDVIIDRWEQFTGQKAVLLNE